MKRTWSALLLALFFLGNAPADFDPKEPIRMDLKDAKVTEVIRTLGALADLPVVIGEGVEGTITVRFDGVPFERALELISQIHGISLRIADGKLVASLPSKALPAAPPLPLEFRDAPRILVSDYSKASFHLSPIVLRARWNEEENCHRLEFTEKKTAISVPLPGDTPSFLTVTQFGFEGVSKIRYLAVEGEGIQRVLTHRPKQFATIEKMSVSGTLGISVSDRVGDGCASAGGWEAPKAVPTHLRVEVRNAVGELLMAPRLGLLPGTVFVARSGSRDDETGQQREIRVNGYLSTDGESAAIALVATAIWSNDGREYVLAQSSTHRAAEFHSLRPEGAVSAWLPAGAATPSALELKLFLETPRPARPAPGSAEANFS